MQEGEKKKESEGCKGREKERKCEVLKGEKKKESERCKRARRRKRVRGARG